MKDNPSILFDLDGTLLPMDYDRFTQAYFRELCARMAPRGYQPKALVDAIWAGVKAIVRGDGDSTCEARFWDKFARVFGDRVYADKAIIDGFYTHEFNNASAATQPTPLARTAVDLARRKGDKVVLATNPIFPLSGVQSRLSWAGLAPEDFDLITSYETCHFCKPDPRYYREILEGLGLDPHRCLMIGNDVEEDIRAARSLGMQTFLIKDCLIGDATRVSTPSGTFQDCIAFLEALPDA